MFVYVYVGMFVCCNVCGSCIRVRKLLAHILQVRKQEAGGIDTRHSSETKKKIALIKVEWCWTLIDHGYQEFLLHFSSTHVLDFEHDPAGVSTLSHYVAMGVSVAQGDIP